MEYILNGQAQGSVASTLLASNFDVASLRPWIGQDGRSYIAQNQGGKLVAVPTMVRNATLRHEEWKILDTAVVQTAMERLRVVADLRGAGLTFNIPNGMSKTVLETQTIGEITGATISMDPARQGEGDRPEYDLTNLPLPVIHKDFSFTARQIAVSRNGGTPLDVTMAQMAARKVAEEAEKLTLGVSSSYTYGGGTVYGLRNYPYRLTAVLTHPTQSDWTGAKCVQEVLAMRQQSMDIHYYGPWALYISPSWGQYFDEDYSASKGDNTLRMRIAQIEGIREIRQADFLTGYQMLLVQLTSDVIRMVIGMDVTTVQWETLGGMLLNFKVMAMMVPQIRADANNACGIVHATAA